MKSKMCTALLAFVFYVASLQAGMLDDWVSYFWAGESAKPPAIKILITHDQPGVVLEVKGKYKIFDPKNNSHISTRYMGKRKFVQAQNDGLKWGEGFPGVHQIKVVPDDTNTVTLIDGVEYKGSIYVYDVGGAISIVNEINVEDFLKTTLASQFENGTLPEEELSAIAITARTNATYQAKNPKNTFWDVEASKVGYEGQSHTHAQGYAIKKAIDKTRYMVMLKDQKLFPAVWGTATGGKINQEKVVFSRITLFEAEEMAKSGSNAAQILEKAFPETVLRLSYTS
ncbi:MAG: SpoIID/LytB domain-containing protein [Parachlamydiaceae bacterium]